MKITYTDNIIAVGPEVKKNLQNSTGKHFGDILKEVATVPPAMSQLGNSREVPPAGMGTRFVTFGARKEFLCRADELLGLLESMQRGLSGSGLTLTEAHTSMALIEDRADELSTFVANLPEGDDFRDFLNRLAITASLVVLKFRRGDFQ